MSKSHFFTTRIGIFLLACSAISPTRGEPPAQNAPPNLAARLFQTPEELRLTDEQKRLVKALIEEYEPKLAQFQTEILDALSKEQRQARAESFRLSREAPASGKALREASIADLKLSEGEQQRLEETRTQKSRMKQEALQKFHALLTEEQRQMIESLQGPRKNRPDARTLLKNHSGTQENMRQKEAATRAEVSDVWERLHLRLWNP